MSVDWSYFNKFDDILDRYLPGRGEGETIATQIVTAVSKLVYKWYNDGDVFDNTHALTGWCNDLSSYANWLLMYAPGAGPILWGICGCENESDYEELLQRLADRLLDGEDLEKYARKPKEGSIYKCPGPFKFEELVDNVDEW